MNSLQNGRWALGMYTTGGGYGKVTILAVQIHSRSGKSESVNGKCKTLELPQKNLVSQNKSLRKILCRFEEFNRSENGMFKYQYTSGA